MSPFSCEYDKCQFSDDLHACWDAYFCDFAYLTIFTKCFFSDLSQLWPFCESHLLQVLTFIESSSSDDFNAGWNVYFRETGPIECFLFYLSQLRSLCESNFLQTRIVLEDTSNAFNALWHMYLLNVKTVKTQYVKRFDTFWNAKDVFVLLLAKYVSDLVCG